MSKFESAILVSTEGYSNKDMQDFLNSCVKLGATPCERVPSDLLPDDYKFVGVDEDDYQCCYNPTYYRFIGLCTDGDTLLTDDLDGAKVFDSFSGAITYLAEYVISEKNQAPINFAKELLEKQQTRGTPEVELSLCEGDLDDLFKVLDSKNVELTVIGGVMNITVDTDVKFYINSRAVLLRTIQFLAAKKVLEELLNGEDI